MALRKQMCRLAPTIMLFTLVTAVGCELPTEDLSSDTDGMGDCATVSLGAENELRGEVHLELWIRRFQPYQTPEPSLVDEVTFAHENDFPHCYDFPLLALEREPDFNYWIKATVTFEVDPVLEGAPPIEAEWTAFVYDSGGSVGRGAWYTLHDFWSDGLPDIVVTP